MATFLFILTQVFAAFLWHYLGEKRGKEKAKKTYGIAAKIAYDCAVNGQYKLGVESIISNLQKLHDFGASSATTKEDLLGCIDHFIEYFQGSAAVIEAEEILKK